MSIIFCHFITNNEGMIIVIFTVCRKGSWNAVKVNVIVIKSQHVKIAAV